MLLLDSENATINSARKVVVISTLDSVQNQLSQLLRSHGIEQVEVINRSLQSEDIVLNAEETVGVIIDIGDDTDVQHITEQVNAIVPQQMWCCLVGCSDSISLAQKLLEQNILYFNRDSQLNLMMNRIVSSTMNIPNTRNTVKVCVLGCKGGVGASFIASQIANVIAENKKVPVLLAQGTNGTQDLDLLFDKKLAGGVVAFEENLDLLNGDFKQLSLEERQKYNFIIYDQPIFNVSKDEQIGFFDIANSFVLVVDRHPNSLRIAKRFLELCERRKAQTGQLIRTFICVIDSRMEHATLMSKADIESLLGSPVDAVIPFLRKTSAPTVLSIKLSKNMTKSITELTLKIIGVLSRTAKKEKNSVLKAIWQKILR
ncbi:pilus assembly protein [Actinobacillus delphinicola]|uniref:Flp pilus assembly protein, ATPase n=1 Tax=Actinobacillus delphinicola TaxID=51161 RepID=A0A448TWB2_9PAST|nr:pilus assembly protein [Actinobacillus delphinicola]MDG6896767.1 pilus assembly protein [Actinobacillus delphinicola]VEJ10199.1 Flp pilus assembly protein, ATPase [Actinobacillus delphinicola]